jgi:hypothetical protein
MTLWRGSFAARSLRDERPGGTSDHLSCRSTDCRAGPNPALERLFD